ncbi:MAG: hypothetical protein MHMPM18_003382 [Marteilia pararefringens]
MAAPISQTTLSSASSNAAASRASASAASSTSVSSSAAPHQKQKHQQQQQYLRGLLEMLHTIPPKREEIMHKLQFLITETTAGIFAPKYTRLALSLCLCFNLKMVFAFFFPIDNCLFLEALITGVEMRPNGIVSCKICRICENLIYWTNGESVSENFQQTATFLTLLICFT